METQYKCVIWGTPLTSGAALRKNGFLFLPNQGIKDLINQHPFISDHSGNDQSPFNFMIYNPWAGGKYTLSSHKLLLGLSHGFNILDGNTLRPLNDKEKIRLSGYIAQKNLNNKTPPDLDAIMKDDNWLSNLPHIPNEEERSFMLLKGLKFLESHIGEYRTLYIIQDRNLGGYNGICTGPFFWALSYCRNVSEFNFLLFDLLKKQEFIEVGEPIKIQSKNPFQPIKEVHIKVTPKGLKKIREDTQHKSPNQNSKKVFISMWMDNSIDFLKKIIKKTVKEMGYNPSIIEEEPDDKKICEKINSEIEKSRFIICDLTSEPKKPRGSVYFEAGYAKGFKKTPVIFTCDKDLEKEIAFVIRQYPIIFWKKSNIEKFKEDLQTQIKIRQRSK